MLDHQPVLEGELLLLRPLCAEDWDALFTVASDPLIWELHPAHDRWREDVFCAFFDDALGQAGALAVIDKASGRIIGSSRFQGLEPENGGSVEIGWTFLAREYWGGTFNREMKWLMLDYALASVAECRFAVGEKNLRSRRALKKIGARLIERVDERAMAGGIVRHVHYVINREDFMRSGLSQPGSCQH